MMMKKHGIVLTDPECGEMKCSICGEDLWEHKITKKKKIEKYRCINGCMDLFPGWDTNQDPPKFLGYFPF